MRLHNKQTVLLKALENNFAIEASILITNLADFKLFNREGLNSLDYIFAKDLENIKEVLINVLGLDEFKRVSKLYTDERVMEIKKVINNGAHDAAKSHDFDTMADTTMLSRMSETVPSVDIIGQEEVLMMKMREIQAKTAEVANRVKKLGDKNKKLKLKVKKNEQKTKNCTETKNIEPDPMVSMVTRLTSEINGYNNWVNDYRRASAPLFEDVYGKVSAQLTRFYGSDITISQSGSYENGLLMPWSDLNLVVAFHHGRNENKNRGLIMEKIKKFSKLLKNKKDFIQNSVIEERSSLVILKLNLTKQYRELTVEVIFKYYVNGAYPSNEETVIQYLQRYPVIKPIYTIFRTMLHKTALDDPSIFGLKSVAVVLIIVAFLQQMEFTSADISELSMGQLFVNFLFYYSYSFDYNAEAIQCSVAKDIDSSPYKLKNPRRRINALEIGNPYNEEIILTKSFKRTGELKQLIKLCYISLFSQCSCPQTKEVSFGDKFNCESPKNKKNFDALRQVVDDLERFESVQVNYNAQKVKKFTRRPLQKKAECFESKNPGLAKRKVSTVALNFERELSLVKPEKREGSNYYMIQGLLNFNFEQNLNI